MKQLLFIIFLSLVNPCFAQNTISNFSGNGTAGLTNGSPTLTQFNEPFGICRDSIGNLYIADGANHCIRKIDIEGNSSIYAGSTVAGYADGPLVTAQFDNPTNVCFDHAGNLLVADFLNQRIRQISPTGIVTTVAGDGQASFQNGAADQARFNYPRGIAVDSLDNIYVADSWNHRIRKIDRNTNQVSTYAGGGFFTGVGSVGGLADENGGAARFYTPSGITIDNQGNLYVADPFNHRIRKIDTDRNVTTVGGTGTTGPNNGGYADGDAQTAAVFNTPTDLFWAGEGTLLISDTFNNRVRKIDSEGITTTIGGNGNAGFVNGVDSLSEFNFPRGITSNAAQDSIFVVDYNNHTVRLIYSDIVSSVEEVTENSFAIQLFPNPVEDRLWIQLEGMTTASELKIYNALGALMCQRILDNERTELEVSEFESGIYFVIIEGQEKFLKKTFVVP